MTLSGAPERMPHAVLGFMGLIAILVSWGTTNPLESSWAILILILCLHWFLWKQQPAILLYFLILPFIEGHTSVLQANQEGLLLNELFPETGRKTFWLASMGFLSVMLGLRTALRRRWQETTFSIDSLRAAAEQIDQRKLILAILLAHALASALARFIPYGSSLQQFETYIYSIPDALTLAFSIHFFLTRQRPLLVLGLFLYLFATSFYSYFASWRMPIVIALIGYATSLKQFRSKELLRLAPAAIPMLLLVLTWQSVKSDYRSFLSGGSNDQALRVTQTAAISKFSELATESVLSNSALGDEVISSTYERAGYLEYFSAAVGKVPEEIPHQQGSLTRESLEFSLIPRILNPNKGVKNDREKVERFTDYSFGGAYNVSSFSLGHYCEAYIDWGPRGMMVHLFLYGYLGGWLYLLIKRRTQSLNPLLSLGLMYAILIPWGTFQGDLVTITGKLFWGCICQLIIFTPAYTRFNRLMTN